jgi:hypothetical protein
MNSDFGIQRYGVTADGSDDNDQLKMIVSEQFLAGEQHFPS